MRGKALAVLALLGLAACENPHERAARAEAERYNRLCIGAEVASRGRVEGLEGAQPSVFFKAHGDASGQTPPRIFCPVHFKGGRVAVLQFELACDDVLKAKCVADPVVVETQNTEPDL